MDAQVVVIGAGVSGLSTAQFLKKQGYKVLIVEASDRHGGRIRCESEPLGPPLEVGGEIIHEYELFKSFFGDKNWEVKQLITWAQGDGPANYLEGQLTCFWFNQERRLLNSVSFEDVVLDENGEVSKQVAINDELSKEAKRSSEILASLSADQPEKLPSVTLNEYFRKYQKLRHPSVVGIVEAGFSNTYCSSSDVLNTRNVAISQTVFEDHHEYEHKLKLGFSGTVVPTLREGLDIKLNWQAVTIDHSSPNSVVVTNTKGEHVKAPRVVVTVPCSVVSELVFKPPLPKPFAEVLDDAQMFPALKLILLFNKRFWPKQLHGMICSGSVFPEMWFLERGPNSFGVVGFATATHAKGIQALGETMAVEALKTQLNTIFGQNKKPAHEHYYKHVIYDWSKHQHIRGGYANVLAPEQIDVLLNFSDPKVFFAGDLFTRSYPDLGAALASSRTAAERVAASLPQAKL